MFVPDYSITPKILKNIADIEYARALIETTTILPQWEERLKKEAQIETIINSLQLQGKTPQPDKIKKIINNLTNEIPVEIKNLINALEITTEIAENQELEEVDLKFIHKKLGENILPKTKLGAYTKETVLASTTLVFDWYNSLDAKETHPVIQAAILKAALENIGPFEQLNKGAINLCVIAGLKSRRYYFKHYISLGGKYEQILNSMDKKNPDFTTFIEAFAENFARQAFNISQQVLLLAKDTKIAKATGRAKLSNRQERIVEYIQDYGMLQNKDFSRLFPDISEDTVLRDLKKLISKNIVQKLGSTKSSRYELV